MNDNKKNRYGLIGRNISHSFSEKYFSKKFQTEKIENATYKTFDLAEISELPSLLQIEKLDGFNVTIPYKEDIFSYLDELNPEAEKIGAVNCVKILNGKKIGYNTDAFGFETSLKPLLENHHKQALILGDGGAAKAVKFVLEKLGITYQTVSRKGNFTYSDLDKTHLEDYQIIINTTPLGTFPDLYSCPEIPYEFLSSAHLVYDLVYNPEKTKFLKLAESKFAKIKNGYEMLVLQAEKSWEIWNQPL